MKHNPGFLHLVEDARARVAETDVASVHARIERGDAYRLIDVREDSEWERGHIPGATHIGRGVLERDIETLIPDPGTDIVLYCGGGYRSALAADALQRMGYTSVKSMAGGFRGWKEADLPVEGG